MGAAVFLGMIVRISLKLLVNFEWNGDSRVVAEVCVERYLGHRQLSIRIDRPHSLLSNVFQHINRRFGWYAFCMLFQLFWWGVVCMGLFMSMRAAVKGLYS